MHGKSTLNDERVRLRKCVRRIRPSPCARRRSRIDKEPLVVLYRLESAWGHCDQMRVVEARTHLRVRVSRNENINVHLARDARERIEVSVRDDLVSMDDAYPDRPVCERGGKWENKCLQRC